MFSAPPRPSPQVHTTDSPSSRGSSFKSMPFTPRSDISKIPSLVDRLRAITSGGSSGISSSSRLPTKHTKDILPGITLTAQELFTSPLGRQFYEAASQLVHHSPDPSGKFSVEQLAGLKSFLEQYWPHHLVYSEVDITAKNVASAKLDLADHQAAALHTANLLQDKHAQLQTLRARHEEIIEDLKLFNIIIGWLSKEAKINSAKATQLEEELGVFTVQGEAEGSNCADSLAEVTRMEEEWTQKVQQRQAMSDAYAALQQLFGIKP